MHVGARKISGFTIVELLIVIVVIAILATITIVAYNGIRDSAEQSAQVSALTQVSRKLKTHATQHGDALPTSLSELGISSDENTTYDYQFDTTVNPHYYCVSVKTGSRPMQFVSSNNERPASGSCRDLVGWWPLNGDTNDSGKYGYTATGSGTPTSGQNNQSGAYSFGSTFLTVSGINHDVLRPTGLSASWTFSAWAQATSTTQTNESMVIGRPGCHGGLYTYSGQYQFAIKTAVPGNCWSGSVALSGIAIDTAWHHLVGVYEAGQMHIYVDGSFVQSGTFDSSMNGYGTVLSIGGATGRIFDGKVDDARVYTRVLSANEIQDLYDGGAF